MNHAVSLNETESKEQKHVSDCRFWHTDKEKNERDTGVSMFLSIMVLYLTHERN